MWNISEDRTNIIKYTDYPALIETYGDKNKYAVVICRTMEIQRVNGYRISVSGIKPEVDSGAEQLLRRIREVNAAEIHGVQRRGIIGSLPYSIYGTR